jgi:acetyl esterase/lipase
MEFPTPPEQDMMDPEVTRDAAANDPQRDRQSQNEVLAESDVQEEYHRATLHARYEISRDLTYSVRDGRAMQLDLYLPRREDALNPDVVVMFMHGGCWISGSKEDAIPHLDPFLELGMTVANVEYRLAHVAYAPAAIDDCRTALYWLIEHARDFGYDPSKMIVAGVSSGGHLALMTGILGPANLPTRPEHSLATALAPARAAPGGAIKAILNWSGMTDMTDLLSGPQRTNYAAAWFGDVGIEPLARLVSPVYAVRPSMAPVLTIHGTADPVVPFSQALKLQDALSTAGVRHQFLGIPEAGHGAYSPSQRNAAHQALREFLFDHSLIRFSRETNPSRGLVDEILERIYEGRIAPGQSPGWRHSTAPSLPPPHDGM